MPARYLVQNPCQDACGTVATGRTLEGAPVYLCPGCDSQWIELHERTAGPTGSPGGESASAPDPT